MKINRIFLVLVMFVSTMLFSCTSTSIMMKEPVNYVEMSKADFEFSYQLSGQAQATYVFGIDFERLFDQKTGKVDKFSVPFIGAYISNFDPASRVKSFAL